MAELDKRAEDVLRSNIEILYSQLDSSIQDFFKYGYHKREIRYINAYLSATLNAIISYVDRLMEVGRMKNNERIRALKFANNLQKHQAQLICLSKTIGGFTFPFCIEGEFEIPKIELFGMNVLDWKLNQPTKRKHMRSSLRKNQSLKH